MNYFIADFDRFENWNTLDRYWELNQSSGLPQYVSTSLSSGFGTAWMNRRRMTGRRGSRK